MDSLASDQKRNSIQKTLATLAILFPGALFAQSPLSSAMAEFDRAGFGLYSISSTTSFANVSSPIFNPQSGGVQNAQYDTLLTGISTSIGWRSRKSKTFHLDLRFAPSYFYETSSLGFSTSNYRGRDTQNASVNWSHKIGHKWDLHTNLGLATGTYNQLLFAPTPGETFLGIPGTPEEFMGAALTGNGENADLNAAVGAPNLLTPQQSLLFGDRILSINATVGLFYTATPRLTFTFDSSGTRMQHLSSLNGDQPGLIHQSTGVSGGVGVQYALDPRTHLTGSVQYFRPISSIYQESTASARVGISRSLTDHVFASVNLGSGYIISSGQQNVPNGIHRAYWLAGGSVGYRLFRHSFMASASRSVSDVYGIGAGATVSVIGAWSWSMPNSPWVFTAGIQDFRLEDSVLNRNGYRVHVGVSRSLHTKAFFTLMYARGDFSIAAQALPGVNQDLLYKTDSVMLSIGFRPFLGVVDVDRKLNNTP